MSVISIRRATSTSDMKANGPAWRPWSDEEERTGYTRDEMTPESERMPLVLLSCPNGHVATVRDHTIASDGTVTPSLLCFVESCGWHVFGRLEGWSG